MALAIVQEVGWTKETIEKANIPGDLKATLETFCVAAKEQLFEFRKEIESWFDSGMTEVAVCGGLACFDPSEGFGELAGHPMGVGRTSLCDQNHLGVIRPARRAGSTPR